MISWNNNVGYLLASGADDGSFKVWDLREVGRSKNKNGSSNCEPLANFSYHTSQITSIEWAPNDESVLATCSADNQLTVWDLSVEADAAMGTNETELGVQFPPQLLFIHQGQNNMKELHFHPHIPTAIASTAEDSLNIFKPAISVASS